MFWVVAAPLHLVQLLNSLDPGCWQDRQEGCGWWVCGVEGASADLDLGLGFCALVEAQKEP